jgi:hypothetical protein
MALLRMADGGGFMNRFGLCYAAARGRASPDSESYLFLSLLILSGGRMRSHRFNNQGIGRGSFAPSSPHAEGA